MKNINNISHQNPTDVYASMINKITINGELIKYKIMNN